MCKNKFGIIFSVNIPLIDIFKSIFYSKQQMMVLEGRPMGQYLRVLGKFPDEPLGATHKTLHGHCPGFKDPGLDGFLKVGGHVGDYVNEEIF